VTERTPVGFVGSCTSAEIITSDRHHPNQHLLPLPRGTDHHRQHDRGAGTYAIEYDLTANAAFFDTYVDGTELGYIGGATGTYLTRSVQLSSGGHLVQVAGPEGSGTANVYIVATN
jgi:hypothetical protein